MQFLEYPVEIPDGRIAQFPCYLRNALVSTHQFLARRVELLHKVEKTISLTIFCMLFTFGVTIGSNDELISNLDKFGYQAALLAILGTAGSLCCRTL